MLYKIGLFLRRFFKRRFSFSYFQENFLCSSVLSYVTPTSSLVLSPQWYLANGADRYFLWPPFASCLLFTSYCILLIWYLFVVFYLPVFLGLRLTWTVVIPIFLTRNNLFRCVYRQCILHCEGFFVTACRTDIYVCISAATVFLVSLSSHAIVFLPYYTTVLPIFESFKSSTQCWELFYPDFGVWKFFLSKFS